ncbi:Mitochondrial tRNAs modification protein [Savitreella phatthalungensis]
MRHGVGFAHLRTTYRLPIRHHRFLRRPYSILGIETSCDDTCVSVLSFNASEKGGRPKIAFERIIRSLDLNEMHGGIHPLVALESHKRNITQLINDAIMHCSRSKLGLGAIACTQGPGMRRSLEVGIDAAQTCSARLGVPLIGVHHMQAHALTPRLLNDEKSPEFPYLSLLVSGGHTLLVHSQAVADHRILATTRDIAIGDMIDKVARLLNVSWQGQMPGAALESWCRDASASENEKAYIPLSASIDRAHLAHRFTLTRPLHAKLNIDGQRHERMGFSFSGLGTQVERILRRNGDLTAVERIALGGEAMRHAFEHAAVKVVSALKAEPAVDARTCERLTYPSGMEKCNALVVSGGVARNMYLRQILRQHLEAAGFARIPIICPPLELCSDNATMIAWAAFEMMREGLAEGVHCRSLPTERRVFEARPKWSLTDLLTREPTRNLVQQAS